MNDKVEQALERLNTVLPLKRRQDECDEQARALHWRILCGFVELGRMLTRAEMARSVDDLGSALAALKQRDMVVFDAAGVPVGAYPFTMEQREHRVRVNGHTVHAMCALDALAVSPMFGFDTRIDSRCRVSGAALCIEQSGDIVANPQTAGGTRVGIIWGAADGSECCADSLCLQMLFLKDAGVAQRWCEEDSAGRETFTLAEAIEFARRFFLPLVAR